MKENKLIPLLNIFNLMLITTFLSSCFKPEENSERSPSSEFAPQPSTNVPMKWSNSALSDGLKLHIAQELIDDLPSEFNDTPEQDNIIVQFKQKWDESITEIEFFPHELEPVANKDLINLQDYQDGEMGIYFSQDWYDEIGNDVLAIMQFFGTRINVGTSDETILFNHADIILNFTLRDQMTWDNSEDFGYDLPSIILHEVGHFLGLPHDHSGENSVMRPTINTFTQYNEIFGRDESALKNLYDSNPTHSALSQDSFRGLQTNDPDEDEGEPVRGFIELSQDGECRHFINGQHVYSHSL